jgi:tRNA threonylcarbamoyladenosine biosynthesis protein TsaE
MSHSTAFELPNEAATEQLGVALARYVKPSWIVYLQGDLGAGKTTLARALLRALGHEGKVKSPTYTLIEPYTLPDLAVYHLDLYRLGDPEELDYIGLRDLLEIPALMLIEWPERGLGFLPAATLTVQLDHQTTGRHCNLSSADQENTAAMEHIKQTVAELQH